VCLVIRKKNIEILHVYVADTYICCYCVLSKVRPSCYVLFPNFQICWQTDV